MSNIVRAAAVSAALAFAVPAFAGDTIVDKAVATDDLSTLVTAVQAADLAGTLSSEGPFTVFAPTNDAFGALPEGTLDAVLADKEALTGILTYHVVGGAEVPAADLLDAIKSGGGSHTVTTVAGGTFTAALEGDSVVLTDAQGNKATVIATDVDASNGIVHVIDGVLLP